MHLSREALGIGPGDEVITPSMTWVSTVNLITLQGAKPVFAEIDKNTLLVQPEDIEKKITDKTKLIIPVHFAGVPADLDEINSIAGKHGIPVIEDAAHAIGTSYKGRPVGALGTVIYSFHPIKNITTGEGGMLCSDNREFLDKIRQLKFHGLGVDAYDRNTQGRSPQAEVLEPGYKYNMTDISAVLGVRQLARLDEFNAKRSELAALYLKELSGMNGIKPLAFPEYSFRHAWHLFIVRIDSPDISRDDFMTALKEKNIGTGIHFRAVHTQKYYAENMPLPSGSLDATRWNSERICSLPLFPGMAPEDVKDVCAATGEILRNA
jgi:UDP-4-amino-4-deoxy-L-arabinose-oxoglutarate aminotransferase